MHNPNQRKHHITFQKQAKSHIHKPSLSHIIIPNYFLVLAYIILVKQSRFTSMKFTI